MRDPLAVVVDGNNILIRAHGGMSYSNLTTSDGTPSGGLYGTIRVFHMYLAKLKPTHVLWCWDQGGSSFRTAINGEYKGNRPKKTVPGEDPSYDELVATFRNFQEYLGLLGVAQVRKHGVEADDWIAQFVVENSKEIPITILSADHDVRQLIRHPDGGYPVHVLKPSVSNSNSGRRALKEKLYTYDSIIEEYKVPPHRLPELWAIQGDSTDNIRGVPGLGPVRSLAALKEFGDLNGVISHHPKLAGYEKAVHNNYRMIKLPHEEMEPLPFPLLHCRWDDKYFDPEALKAFFEKWEMASFLLKMTTTSGLFGEESTAMKVGMGNIG